MDKAEELDRLTQQKVPHNSFSKFARLCPALSLNAQSLDKSQQERVFELLSEVESSVENSSSSSSQPTKSQQAFRGKRTSLSQSVRRLFRFKVDNEEPIPQECSAP